MNVTHESISRQIQMLEATAATAAARRVAQRLDAALDAAASGRYSRDVVWGQMAADNAQSRKVPGASVLCIQQRILNLFY